MNDKNKLDNLINDIVNTLKFYGAEITGIDLSPKGLPSIRIIVHSRERKKSLQEVLDLAYWSLWTLLYGEYSDDKKDLKINLLYDED